MMVVVTGATGKLGGMVVERLLTRVSAEEIAVSVRDPGKANALAGRGVRVRRGDYDDAVSLAHAFEGAAQLLLVSAATTGEAALRQLGTAIGAARAAGVRRIVYTSHMGVNPTSPFAPMPDHAATEAMLQDSGLAFTALRNGFYTSSGRMLLGRAFETGQVAAPEDGPVSWTAHEDLAEAAAIVLTEEERFEGATPPLTGSAAVDLAGLAAVAADVTGRPITRTVVTDAQYREQLVAHGVPEPAADMLLGLFAASRAGEFAAVDPTLEQLLGRPPLTVREVLAKG
jgi:NAD(P)H dehydrogenase (quinone)